MNRFFPALAALMISTGPAMAERVSVLIFDASGSMWNRVEGDLTRIEVARDVMGDYFGSRDGTVPLSVIAYGHNRRGDCGDIEVIAPMGQAAPGMLESRLRGLMPRGMTPLTDSLALARDQIPPTAEAADIILVTDGLETCEGDPCALAASLAAEGIDIRAHVVGFGLSAAEVAALSCITDQTGGMLFQTNSGAELAEALQQVSMAPEAEPEPEQPARAAAFDIGDKAEAGFDYRIRWNGEATNVDFMGFVPQGESRAPSSSSYRTIGGTLTAPNNPATRTAPQEPGMYDLILVTAQNGVIARQAVEVVAPSMGFDPIGSVEPGSRVRFTFRGPEQLGERIVIADLDQPVAEHQRHGWDNALSKKGATTLTVPKVPGEYELRYLNSGATEIMFSRRFGVGIPFADADLTTSADLAALAAAATQADVSQDDLALVTSTFRLPADAPQSDVTWSALPLDPDMNSGPWAPTHTGPVVTGDFEPGNWRITATAPGEVTLSADVAIFPGESNDFTVQVDNDTQDGTLAGEWILWAIPPADIPDQPMAMAQIHLRLSPEGQDYLGRFETTPAMGGPVSGDLISVIEEEAALTITFALPAVSPDPLRLELAPAPDGAAFVGTLFVADRSLPMALALLGTAPDKAGWQEAAGPLVAEGTLVAQCDQPDGCPLTFGRLSLTLPHKWGMTEPLFVAATADASPVDLPRTEFFGQGNGFEIRLNPHQWLDSNGPCIETQAGRLCMFKDAPPETMLTALSMTMSLQLAPADELKVPVTFVTPDALGDKGVLWSVLRTDIVVNDLAYMSRDYSQTVMLELPPGTYSIEGNNEGEQVLLALTITVAPNQPNRFEIPFAGGTQPSATAPSSASPDTATTQTAAQTGPDVINPVFLPGQNTITGRLTLSIDNGEPVELVTHSRRIPAVMPPAGADQAVIDFMTSMSGRVIHSASWTVVSGPVIVTLDAAQTLELRTEGAGVKMTFNLDPTTLDLLSGSESIEITPNTLEFRQNFDLSEPRIGITSLRTGDENAMAIAGDFSGIGPDGLTYSGTFNIDAVTGSSLMLDVLTGR
jgi:hypothetical protein